MLNKDKAAETSQVFDNNENYILRFFFQRNLILFFRVFLTYRDACLTSFSRSMRKADISVIWLQCQFFEALVVASGIVSLLHGIRF